MSSTNYKNKFTPKELTLFTHWRKFKADYKTIYARLKLLALILIFCVPLIIFIAYYIGDNWHIWINTSLTVGDALSFYASIFSAIATIFLGIVAVYQTDRANKIAQKSMLIAGIESKPILTIEQCNNGGCKNPYVGKSELDYSVSFMISNKSSTAAFNVQTIGLWISNVELKNDNLTIENRERYEIPMNKIYWDKRNYDFQGCIFPDQQHYFSTGIHFCEHSIDALEKYYGGRYFLSVTFTFENISGDKFKETDTILIARLQDGSEMIFDNRIDIEEIR